MLITLEDTVQPEDIHAFLQRPEFLRRLARAYPAAAEAESNAGFCVYKQAHCEKYLFTPLRRPNGIDISDPFLDERLGFEDVVQGDIEIGDAPDDYHPFMLVGAELPEELLPDWAKAPLNVNIVEENGFYVCEIDIHIQRERPQQYDVLLTMCDIPGLLSEAKTHGFSEQEVLECMDLLEDDIIKKHRRQYPLVYAAGRLHGLEQVDQSFHVLKVIE